jgi:hypothetical protein
MQIPIPRVKSIYTLLFYISLLYSAPLLAQTPANTGKTTPNTAYNFSIFENANHTYGYDIYNNKVLVIHQPTIPGRAGLLGFKTKSDAEKVATLAISKIAKGVMPPTITDIELKKLKI